MSGQTSQPQQYEDFGQAFPGRYWHTLYDDTPDLARAMAALDRGLARTEWLAALFR